MKIATVESKAFAVVVATFILLPSIVRAHHFMDDQLPETFTQGFLSGVAHPVVGVDHAVFIIAAAFALAVVKRGVLGIIAFILGTLIGAALNLTGFNQPGGEAAVALSVILIGGVVMTGRQITLIWLAVGLTFAGMLHGYAYGKSMLGAETTPLCGYLVGLCFVQLGMASAAMLLHRRLFTTSANRFRPISYTVGAVISAIGVLFLASNAIA
ncbi:MAG: HupE/UreJ family protein [Pseudomonadota bacterium]|nr:HupE/UreJ family protein [Pseudomonadota bacterium]